MSWTMSSTDLVSCLNPNVLSQGFDHFEGFGTDTREDLSGKLFIALKGDQYDAHNFLTKAVEAGASGLLVHKSMSESEILVLKLVQPKISILQVKDSLIALQALATDWRRKNKFGVLGITGSNGKTTTKEFVTSLLNQKFKVYSSQGSFNNHWGVPFTLLNAPADCDWVVCEMGMNSPGEIARLCEVAEPNVVCVTFVGRGHLEGMGSIENIAKEKSDVYRSSPEAKKIFNLENIHTAKMKDEFFRDGDISFGATGAAVDIQCESADFQTMRVSGKIDSQKFEKTLSVYGQHNVTNLMAASGLALACGMNPTEIIEGLESVKMAWGRNQVEKVGDYTLVFDGYNANPESMDVFISNAQNQEHGGRKIFVLGEMLELGSEAPELHYELGKKLAELNLAQACFFGPSFKQFQDGYLEQDKSKKLVVSSTYEELLALKIINMLQPNDVVFIKASRGIKLERFLKLIKSNS